MAQDYAYEIRFVDDNKVQVFDLARRHLDPTSATLPTEYKTEEVLRGDLRYSKLLGTQQSATEEQWEHVTYTKRGRRSIQRHTFMMGGSSMEDDTVTDLEVGNRDIADIRFNQNNVYQSNSITTTTTNENTASIQSQTTLFELSVTEPIVNSPDYNQSKHYEFVEEVDMANLTNKPSIRVNDDIVVNNNTDIEEGEEEEEEEEESAVQSVSSQSFYGRTRYSHFDNKKQSDSDTESSQQLSKGFNETGYDSRYSSDKRYDQIKPDSQYDNLQSTLNDRKNNMGSQYILENGGLQQVSLKHQNAYAEQSVLKSPKELSNSINPAQNQQLYYRDGNNMDQDYIQLRQYPQKDQGQSTLGHTSNNGGPPSNYSQNTRNTTTTSATTINPTYYSINIPTTDGINNNEANLTRVKSVPLENYDASPERSCCIIS